MTEDMKDVLISLMNQLNRIETKMNYIDKKIDFFIDSAPIQSIKVTRNHKPETGTWGEEKHVPLSGRKRYELYTKGELTYADQKIKKQLPAATGHTL